MKKKTAIILAIIALIVASVGGFFLMKLLDDNHQIDYSRSDAEFLAIFRENGQWRKKDDDSVVWRFSDDGTCQITTNYGTVNEWYDCVWYTKDGILGIKTSWLYDLENEFFLTTDNIGHSFTVENKGDGTKSAFYAEYLKSDGSLLEPEEKSPEE